MSRDFSFEIVYWLGARNVDFAGTIHPPKMNSDSWSYCVSPYGTFVPEFAEDNENTRFPYRLEPTNDVIVDSLPPCAPNNDVSLVEVRFVEVVIPSNVPRVVSGKSVPKPLP